MPPVRIVLYKELDGKVPLLSWLDGLPEIVQDKCIVKVKRLRELGHELRRPEADYLRDGIYELRVRHGSVNYRMLYFFHGKNACVISHGLKKEKEVPEIDINRAISRKTKYESDPDLHAFVKRD